ncbi:MAG TPA: zf-HC2 domain-containing protein [Sporichthyaceae bacterium]|nr:zf-HC2 domain-containing protein [Sporichthyaceae bacterium]
MTHLGHRLSGYLDGELPPATAELVAGHLLLCGQCRTAAKEQSRTKVDLRDLGGPAPSAGLLSSLLDMSGPFEPPTPTAWDRLPVAEVGRRRLAGAAPLFAAGVAGIAAISMASTVFTAAAPQRAHQVSRTTATGGRARSAPNAAHVGYNTVPASPTPTATPPAALTGSVRVPLAAAISLVRPG